MKKILCFLFLITHFSCSATLETNSAQFTPAITRETKQVHPTPQEEKFCQQIGQSYQSMKSYLYLREEPVAFPEPSQVLSPEQMNLPQEEKDYLLLSAFRKEAKKYPLQVFDQKKDRYRAILVYQDNRLCVPGSNKKPTHINASPFLGEDQSYILTQGPMQKTLPHFFSMLWMTNTKVLLALTNPQEGGQDKCAPYWLMKKDSFKTPLGSLKVVVKSPEKIITEGPFTLWKRTIILSIGTESKEVVHYWVENWSDHGIINNDILQCLVEEVGRLQNKQGAICVHCSAGVGRTGVVISALEGAALYAKKKPVDLLHIVLRLNAARWGCVEKKQYMALFQFFTQRYTQSASKPEKISGS